MNNFDERTFLGLTNKEVLYRFHMLFAALVLIGQLGHAQTEYFYYYNKKIYIEVDRDYVCVNSSQSDGYLDTYNYNFISKSNHKGINSRNLAVSNDSIVLNRKHLKNYYSEIQVTSSVKNSISAYLGFINTLSSDAKTIKASKSYKTTEGERLGLTNNFYVKVHPGSLVSLITYSQSVNVEILGMYPHDDSWYILSCTKDNPKNALELANQFKESGLFVTAEPEFIYHNLQASNDPFYSSQWGLKNTGQQGMQYSGIDINVEPAWNITKGNGVKVAIYDTGFELNHPDLAPNVFGTGFDIHNGTSPSTVRGWHGSPCAGIIGAVQDNNIGISGVAPECEITSISANLWDTDPAAALASGFDWAVNNQVDVISCSWGGYAPSALITDAINRALTIGRGGKGCVVVFATGNYSQHISGVTPVLYPQSEIPKVLVVGAISNCGRRKDTNSCSSVGGSRFGDPLDVMAPGQDIASTDLQGYNGYNNDVETNPLFIPEISYTSNFENSSAACPFVAGVAALMLSVNPCLSVKQVSDIIEQTAQKIGGYPYAIAPNRYNGTWHEEMGYGLVNAHAAVQLAQSMTENNLDLYVKDSPTDMGIEPNSVTQYMWTSEDIWVRNFNDNGLSHENPDYSANGNPNFVQVRVVNKSCVASTGNELLKLYWAKASTSLAYPNPWLGGSTHPTTGASMGSPIGTLNIPILQPGEETILVFPWIVPNPADYGNDGDQWHFCLLTRIVGAADPMSVPETTNLNSNVRENNNIAWKNVTVVDLLTNNIGFPGGVVAVGNPFNQPKNFNLEMKIEDAETGKPIYQEAEVGIKMSDVLYQAWIRGGKQSDLLSQSSQENQWIIKGDKAILRNIAFNANEIGTLSLNFNFLVAEQTEKTKYAYHIIQKDALTGEVLGGETFLINKKQRPNFDANAPDKEVDLHQTITISADDINEPAIYNWYDENGDLVFQGKNLQIANAVAEKFKLEVISTVDGFKDYDEIQVKIKPSYLKNISPNPASNNVSIGYKLNNANSAYLMVLGSINNSTSNNYILDVNSTETILNISGYPIGFYTVALVVDGEIIDALILIKQ